MGHRTNIKENFLIFVKVQCCHLIIKKYYRYFPKGGGHVRVEVTPVRCLQGTEILERGSVMNISGSSFVSGTLPIKVRKS